MRNYRLEPNACFLVPFLFVATLLVCGSHKAESGEQLNASSSDTGLAVLLGVKLEDEQLVVMSLDGKSLFVSTPKLGQGYQFNIDRSYVVDEAGHKLKFETLLENEDSVLLALENDRSFRAEKYVLHCSLTKDGEQKASTVVLNFVPFSDVERQFMRYVHERGTIDLETATGSDKE